jgi:hypothetical protein
MAERSHFDLDYRDGKVSEDLVDLCIRTVEVKRDRKWTETGNIFIELECRSQDGTWKPSGLAATRAGHWGLSLGPDECQIVVFAPTSVIAECCKQFGQLTNGRKEPNPTRGKLIRLRELFSLLRQDSPFALAKHDEPREE